MNKIIPIISLIVATFGAAVAIVGIIAVCIALRVSGIAVVAVPAAIVGAVISGVSSAVTALFLRSKLCKAAFFINMTALTVSGISIIIWLVAL